MQSTMSIIKDTVLNRCKAYNTTQLMVLMVEIFYGYMRHRLVDVALGKQRVKSITVDKIGIGAVKSFGGGLYSMQSQSDQTKVYEVDLTIGMCTCVKGQDGATCKHQIAGADYSMTAVPQMFVMTSSSRQSLAAVAVGSEKAPKESFFKGLTEVEDNEDESNGGNRTLAAPALAVGAEKTLKESFLKGLNEVEDNEEESNGGNRINKRMETNARELENTNENIADDTSDLTAKSKVVVEALVETTAQYGNSETEVALQKFLRRIRSVKTTNQLTNLLNCAGSSMTYSGAGRGKIPCQPATISKMIPRNA
ncbi:uncharacterized protein LOC135205213 [Macrobrachium nipponense]|uniref:uncharacterized protein LOC135205213 n=1 Tax=Macrobrachium nipponense TaxID=159736 RepID=UPI0030C7EC1C